MIREAIAYASAHQQDLLSRLYEHGQMTAVAVGSAFVVSIGIAFGMTRLGAWRVPLLSVVGLIQTVPGMALLVVAMAIFGRMGTAPAVATLFLFALLPIVQNTFIGLGSIPPNLMEVARGMGMNQWQRMGYLQLPMALPGILAGVRIATVQTIGMATLTAFIGAGGLGQFINRGLFLSDIRLILLGAIPAIGLAWLADWLIGQCERLVDAQQPHKKRRVLAVSAVLALLLVGVGAISSHQPAPAPGKPIVVGSKNFTEQLIVAEMIAQVIEQTTHVPVERRFGLGGSMVMHEAMVRRSVDVAVEYSGTAWAAIVKKPLPTDRSQMLPELRVFYEKEFGLTWLAPLGFDNSYRLAVRADDPRFQGIRTISDLAPSAPHFSAAFDFEFSERADGYVGLRDAYDLHFGQVKDMQPDLLYRALTDHLTDVTSAYTTDGRLDPAHVRLLVDDRHFFPPYQAVIVASTDLLKQHPEIEAALRRLENTMNDRRIQALNASVDQGRVSVEEAAAAALARSPMERP